MVRDGLTTTACGTFISYLQYPIQMLEFCRDTRQDLSNFEADGVSHVHHTQIAVAKVLAHIRHGQPS
jgi:hypothetical protein